MEAGEPEASRSTRGRWLAPLTLAALQLATSAWLIATATAPARDGARYFRYALRLEREPWLQVVRSAVDHPGYPFLVHAALRVAGWLGIDAPAQRVVLVQGIAAICGLLLVLLAYRLMRQLLGRAAAWLGCAAFIVLPGPASCMADVLTDAPHALVWLVAAALFLAALRTARVGLFAAAGVAAGAAYWFRVDALVLPAAAAGTTALLLACGARLRAAPGICGRRVLPRAAAFAAGFATLFILFFVTVGKWSPKPSAEDLLLGLRESSGAAAPVLAEASLALASLPVPKAAWRALVELSEETRTIHLVSLALAALWALRRRAWSIEVAFLGLALLACWLAASALEARSGYASGRYFLPLLPFVVCCGMSFWTALGGKARWRLLAPGVLVLSLSLSLPSLLGESLHASAHGQMEAGRWLAHRLRGAGTVHDPYFFPTYAAGIGDRAVAGLAPLPSSRVHFIIADDRLEARSEELRGLIQQGGAERVASFPRRTGEADRQVHIYRCERAP